MGEFNKFTFLPREAPYSHMSKSLLLAPADEYISEFYYTEPHPAVEVDPVQRCFVKACSVVEMAHLKRFNHEDHRMPAEYARSFNKAVEVVSALLALPDKIKFPGIEGLHTVKFKGGKFSGMHYAKLGFKTRAEAHSTAIAEAEEIWTDLMDGKRVIPHDVRLGGRGKITTRKEGEATNEVPAVGRLILMLSHRDLLVLGNVERELTRPYCSEEYPMGLGQKWCRGGPRQFINRFAGYNKFFCYDAEKYDSSLSSWLVQVAINILRNQFINGNDPEYDAYWQFVMDGLVDAVIQRDDGIRMQKHKGTVSGHSFNTLVQSVITLLIGYTAIIHSLPRADTDWIVRNVHMESLGDDNALAVTSELSHLDLEEIASIVFKAFGVSWFGRKSFATTRLLDSTPHEFQGLQYLGKYFWLERLVIRGQELAVPTPYRPFQETLERLFYPEKGKPGLNQTLERALGNYYDGAGNPETEEWLRRLIEWLLRKGAVMTEFWDDGIMEDLMKDYAGEGDEPPRKRLITRDEWLLWTHSTVKDII